MNNNNALNKGNFDLSNLKVQFSTTLSPKVLALRKIGLLIQMRDNDFEPTENNISEFAIEDYKNFLQMTNEERETELVNLQKNLQNIPNFDPQ